MRTPITDDHRPAEQQLEGLTRTLRNLVAEAPRWSRAADEARRQLDLLERPHCSFSTEQKLSTLREAIQRYQVARLISSSHDEPGNSAPKLGALPSTRF